MLAQNQTKSVYESNPIQDNSKPELQNQTEHNHYYKKKTTSNNGRSIKVAKENSFLEAPLVGNTEGRKHSSLKKIFVGNPSSQTTLIPGVVFFSSAVMFDLDLGSLVQHTLVPFLPNSNNH